MATAAPGKSFFKDDTPHGLIKRVMYKKYLQAFIPITQKYYSTVIIDGFAGAGRYGSGWPHTIEEYGSPIIALIVAVVYLAKTHKQTEIDLTFDKKCKVKSENVYNYEPCSKANITLYFLEADEDNFKSLCKNVKTVLNSFVHQIEDTSYIEELEESMLTCTFHMSEIVLVCKIRKIAFQDFTPPYIDKWTTRCLTFLDPFGYTQTPMKVVQNYVGEGKNVLINFMSSYINRFVSQSPRKVAEMFGIETRHIEEEAQQTGKSKKEVKTEIAAYVKHIRQRPAKARDNHSVINITRNFEKILMRISGSGFSLTFEMRGKNNAIIYHLVFIANHIKEIEEMKESMNRCTQEGNMLGMSDYKIVRLGNEFSLKNDQNPEDVANAIFQVFQGETDSLQEVKKFVLLETPYVFRKKVLKLMERGENPRLCQVRNIDPRTTRTRRAGTFPDWGKWELQFRDDDDGDDDEDDDEHDMEF